MYKKRLRYNQGRAKTSYCGFLEVAMGLINEYMALRFFEFVKDNYPLLRDTAFNCLVF